MPRILSPGQMPRKRRSLPSVNSKKSNNADKRGSREEKLRKSLSVADALLMRSESSFSMSRIPSSNDGWGQYVDVTNTLTSSSSSLPSSVYKLYGYAYGNGHTQASWEALRSHCLGDFGLGGLISDSVTSWQHESTVNCYGIIVMGYRVFGSKITFVEFKTTVVVHLDRNLNLASSESREI